MQAWRHLRPGHAMASSITLLPSSPHINQTLLQIIHVLHFCLVDSLLNYASDVANWVEIMAVRRPLFGMMNAWQLAPFSSCAWHLFGHFNPRLWGMITITEDWETPLSISDVWLAFLAECELRHRSHILFSMCPLWPATAMSLVCISSFSQFAQYYV